MSGTITWQDNVPWAPAPAAKVPDLLPYVQDGQRYQPSKSNRVYQLLDNQVLVTEKFFLEFPRPQTVTSSLFF
jgi:hypothetical protein